MVAYAKASPGAVTYATISIGSQTQLLNELFQQQAGIKMTHVPYRGAGQIVTDVLGGHIATGFDRAARRSADRCQSGAVRGLAIAAEKRLPDYPDLPTYEEQGYPDLVASTWFALSGPANLPRDIVDRLNAEVVEGAACARPAGALRTRGDRHQDARRRRLHGLLQGGSGTLDAARQAVAEQVKASPR